MTGAFYYIKVFMIKAIIGLGNPGRQFVFTRHNIGFRVLDALAEQYGTTWRSTSDAEMATVSVNGRDILLVKPQTFMNSSGKVIPMLTKRGIKPDELLVVHDELELPFGKVAFKVGGSAKGHNGLKSLIAACGPDFARIRCGISRPEKREDVPDYVLSTFKNSPEEVNLMIDCAVQLILEQLS